MSSANVRSAYRNLLKLARSLPPEKQTSSVAQIRLEFRKHATESSQANVAKLLEKASSTISYLKVVTPRKPFQQGGVTRMIFGPSGCIDASDNVTDPKLLGKSGKAISNWTGKNMDPDSVKRHYRGLSRAGFRSNSDVKGIF